MKKQTKVTLQKWAIRGGASIVLLVILVALWNRLQENKAIEAAAQTEPKELDDIQKDSVRQIVRAFRKYGDGDKHKLAYILATARHESHFRPIKEYRATPSQPTIYNLQNRYWYSGYYGRGLVQLTWRSNYQEMGELLNINLVGDPNLALDPYYASLIIVYGMINGNFGHRLDQHINKDKKDYINARRSVNGTDKASLIASYAETIEQKL
jgi:predicted chitinase